MSLNYNFSYSNLADIYAVANEQPEYRKALRELASDLEQTGVGTFEGVTYYMNYDSPYTDEIISEEDYQLEHEY